MVQTKPLGVYVLVMLNLVVYFEISVKFQVHGTVVIQLKREEIWLVSSDRDCHDRSPNASVAAA